ncbi:hypothetical protein JD844_032257 [Phrynosoma platyrhinos]|uniref:Acetylserotonin O-methyltransferase dimerisation domain-containing protein n=1 Tax=Phrynosoma platyrhinos TaxID=52577 RepID=A0ABQ7T5S1_PHRPL|nr:hypothetical protein JD844_032257 [Phrynosoma platyrhinos]
MNSEDTEVIKTLFQQQHGFIISKIMFTAAELGVFDLLRESEEPLTASAIAECLDTSHVGMERLLEACVFLKFLRMEKKDNKGLYGNTVLADLYLAKSSPKSQYYYMKLQSDVYYPGLQYLTDAVREGKGQVKSIHGPSMDDFFQYIYRSEEGMQTYFKAMENSWNLFGREVISEFDLSHFHLVCDLGGGGVLIVEPVLDDERGESFGAHFASIKLLLYNEGKTRTSSEHKALLGVAGFKEIQAKNKGLYGAILGRK